MSTTVSIGGSPQSNAIEHSPFGELDSLFNKIKAYPWPNL